MLELDPTFFAVRRYLGQAYAQKASTIRQLPSFEGGCRFKTRHYERACSALAIAGKKDEAERFSELKAATERYISVQLNWLLRSWEQGRAFNSLERAFQDRWTIWCSWLSAIHWLRSDARFAIWPSESDSIEIGKCSQQCLLIVQRTYHKWPLLQRCRRASRPNPLESSYRGLRHTSTNSIVIALIDASSFPEGGRRYDHKHPSDGADQSLLMRSLSG